MIFFYSFVCALVASGLGSKWFGVMESNRSESMEFACGSITKLWCRSTYALVQSTNQDLFSCHQFTIEGTLMFFTPVNLEMSFMDGRKCIGHVY